MPYLIAVSKRSSERTHRHEGEKQRNEQLSPAKQPKNQREKEIEHLLDRKRPENIPVAGEIAAPGFQYIDVECERGDQGTPESSGALLNDEVSDMRKMKDTQYRQQQGRDAGEPHLVKSPHADERERIPAAKRC